MVVFARPYEFGSTGDVPGKQRTDDSRDRRRLRSRERRRFCVVADPDAENDVELLSLVESQVAVDDETFVDAQLLARRRKTATTTSSPSLCEIGRGRRRQNYVALKISKSCTTMKKKRIKSFRSKRFFPLDFLLTSCDRDLSCFPRHELDLATATLFKLSLTRKTWVVGQRRCRLVVVKSSIFSLFCNGTR